LGKSDFGQLSFALSYLTMFQIISGLGLESIAVRELVVERDSAAKLLGTIFFLRLLAGIINLFISVLLAVFIYGLSDNIYLIIGIAGASLIFQSFSTIELWFQSNNKSFKIVLPKLTATLVTSTVKIYFIINKFSIYHFALLFSVEFLLSGCFLFLSYLKYTVGQRWRFDLGKAKALLKDSWPFLISSLSIYLYTRLDVFMIKKYCGANELGLYSAAITISSILPILPLMLFSVINPIIASKKHENEESYQLYLHKAFQFFTYVGVLLSFFIYLFASYFVHYLYGDEFLDSVPLLRIHVFTNIFIYSGIAQNFWIINENKGKINLYKTAVGVIASFFLGMILIPRFGVLSAAYCALLVQLISSMLINVIVAPELFKLQISSLYKNYL